MPRIPLLSLGSRRWKQIWLGCVGVLACVLMLSLPLWSSTGQEFLNPRTETGGWVLDGANVISPEAEKKINKSVAELHEANGSEIYVVTTPHLPAGETEVQLARRLLEDWTRSCSTTDKGMLVLLSMQDRRWGWRTGCDTEKVLSDSKVRAIMERDAIPYFKRGEYELGLMRAADSFASTLINQRDQGAIGERPVGMNLFMGLLGLVFIVAPTAYLMIQNAVYMSPTGHTVSENGPIVAALKAPTATILGGSIIFVTALISSLLSHSRGRTILSHCYAFCYS